MIRIKCGTNRICLITKKYVYKLPRLKYGFLANRNEYQNYQHNKSVVAYTKKYWWGLKQEKLDNVVTYPRYATIEDIEEEHKHLYKFKLHNRMQIGQDQDGTWKFFDYEDVKFYLRNENEN